MFQKKQYIYSETLGVCRVDNIVQLSTGKEPPVSYYVLTPLDGEEKVSYIPVENHQMVLRELFTPQEAETLLADVRTQENAKLKAALEFVLRQERGEADGAAAGDS